VVSSFGTRVPVESSKGLLCSYVHSRSDPVAVLLGHFLVSFVVWQR